MATVGLHNGGCRRISGVVCVSGTTTPAGSTSYQPQETANLKVTATATMTACAFCAKKSFHSQSLFISKHCHVLLITEWLTGITGVFVLQFTNLLRLKHDYEHVSVCLPTRISRISQELVTQTSPSFTRMLPVAVARLFADICCQITKTTC